jgi:hypothetical protein
MSPPLPKEDSSKSEGVPEENALCSNLPSGYNRTRSTARELLPWVEF